MLAAILSLIAIVVGSLVFGVGIWQQIPVLVAIGLVVIALAVVLPLASPGWSRGSDKEARGSDGTTT